MRVILLSAALAALACPVLAQAPAPAPVGVRQPTPATTAAGRLSAPPANRGENAQAQREADERQKRWDERMRRATRSMCDRC